MNPPRPSRQKWHSVALWTTSLAMLLAFSSLQLGALMFEARAARDGSAPPTGQQPDHEALSALPTSSPKEEAAADDGVPEVQLPAF